MRIVMILGCALAMLSSFAMPPLPKESAKALRVTRGKSFKTGLVFVEGKFLPPPYVVERYGTGIRINKQVVTGQVIDWTEFLKTQEGVKVTKTVEESPAQPEAAAPVAATPPPPPKVEEVDDDDSALDDLFDDHPKPKKAKRAVKAAAPKPKAPPKPKTIVSYEMSGDFIPNEATKTMVDRINAQRTDIERILRSGGFICFGEHYSRVSGDRQTATKILKSLPELMQHAMDVPSFQTAVRAAGLVYFHEALCEDLFRNRIDYRRLQEWRQKLEKEAHWNNLLDSASQSIF